MKPQDIVNENGFVVCSYTLALRNSWPGYKWEQNTGLFEMIVGVLTTCHAQYT